MKALVTGANGFLGRYVVRALLARGIAVRAMVRPAARLEGLGWPSSVEVFRADLRTSRDLPRAFDGVDVLLHLAAVVSGGEDAQFAGTVAGTERLLEGMAATACQRLVLCSSFSVYNYSAVSGTLDEDSPLLSCSSWSAATAAATSTADLRAASCVAACLAASSSLTEVTA